MPFVPVPNTCLAELRYTVSGQQCENTLWFEMAGPIDELALLPLGAALAGWWNTHLRPLQCDNLVCREVYLTDQSSQNGASATITTGLPANGGEQVIDSFPNGTSLCIAFRTAARGRSFRGRNYLVAIPENRADENTVVQSYVNSVLAAYNALPDAVAATGFTHVVASRYSMGAPRVEGVTTPVTAYTLVDNIIDSQRRRLPGRGK